MDINKGLDNVPDYSPTYSALIDRRRRKSVSYKKLNSGEAPAKKKDEMIFQSKTMTLTKLYVEGSVKKRHMNVKYHHTS